MDDGTVGYIPAERLRFGVRRCCAAFGRGKVAERRQSTHRRSEAAVSRRTETRQRSVGVFPLSHRQNCKLEHFSVLFVARLANSTADSPLTARFSPWKARLATFSESSRSDAVPVARGFNRFQPLDGSAVVIRRGATFPISPNETKNAPVPTSPSPHVRANLPQLAPRNNPVSAQSTAAAHARSANG